MTISCEYCGTEFDTSKETICPFCGGSYKDNDEYEEKKAREEESKRIIMERRKLDLERMKNEVEQDRIENVKNARKLRKEEHSNRVGRSLAYFVIMMIIAFIMMAVSSAFMSMKVRSRIFELSQPDHASNTYQYVAIHTENTLNT